MASLEGQTILCLATQEWDAHWTPVQQVMLRLAPRNRVLYFEPFHPPLAWLKKSNSLLRRQRKERVPQLREVRPNLYVYRPRYPYLPRNMKWGVAAALNGFLYRAEIRLLLKRLGIHSPWLWAFFAQSLSVLDLEFEHVIYDCADELPAFFPDPVEKRFVARIDEALCRRADLVFVGSEPLRHKKAPLNPLTFVVNHAADIAHFEKASDSATVVPSDLARIPRPRLGFVGMVDTIRFDANLIARLAENPQYQVVIVGGTMEGAAKTIPALPNVHRLGMKPVHELPSYLKGMDVCLMPYRVNEATRNIYPLKLHEYLATGKPVVSTRIPAVESLRELVYVAESPEDFLRAAASALAEADPALVRSRRSRAQKHSWEAHVKEKSDLIGQHLVSERAAQGIVSLKTPPPSVPA